MTRGSFGPPTCEVYMLKNAKKYGSVGLALALIAVLGSSTLRRGFAQPTQVVPRTRAGDTTRVQVRGNPQLIQQGDSAAIELSQDTVWVRPGARIEFSHSFQGIVTLHFSNAPVTPKRLVLPEGVTGRVLVLASAKRGTYKYNVTVGFPGGGAIKDPYIDVEEGG